MIALCLTARRGWDARTCRRGLGLSFEVGSESNRLGVRRGTGRRLRLWRRGGSGRWRQAATVGDHEHNGDNQPDL